MAKSEVSQKSEFNHVDLHSKLRNWGQTTLTVPTIKILLIYICGIALLGVAVYTNNRIEKCNDRIQVLESFLFGSGDDFMSRKIALSEFNNYNSVENKNKVVNSNYYPQEDENIAFHRWKIQIAGLHRLRRDVTKLKLTRPARQINQCSCPPGEI